MAARKGRTHVTTTAITALPAVRALAEHVPTTGATTIISAAGNKLYSGTTSLSDITATADDVTGITADNWQFQNIAGKLVGFQSGHDPIVRTTGNFSLLQQEITSWAVATAYVLGDVVKATAGNKTIYFQCTTAGTSGGSEPSWSTNIGTTTADNTATWTTRKFPNGDVCHSAFGRIWVTSSADASIVEFSDTLIPHRFRGAAAGTLDLKLVWGGDQVVAISSFEDLLVIFGRKNILLYSGADDPSSMALGEKIEGLGCRARDSVVQTGNDIVFLADSGVRSLSRVVASGGRQPIGDISSNVRDYLMGIVASETAANIKGVYHEAEGFYVLSLPTSGLEFVFDFRFPNPDGTLKVTTWSGFDSTALLSARDGSLYVGYTGVIGKYSTYYDQVLDGAGASSNGTYPLTYRSTWVNFGGDIAQRFKMLKTLRAIVANEATYVITFVYGTDFNEGTLVQDAVTVTSAAGDEWGEGEWNEAEWSGSASAYSEVRTNPTGHGTHIKLGWDATINGGGLAFQELNILAKLGRFN